ncbi:hypothetical protein CW304_21635 [Bacillus sp. UFRGS-B20]|nr:hypothetical protein CW304_21635 [Bacillus sp. UFRGS-B20]
MLYSVTTDIGASYENAQSLKSSHVGSKKIKMIETEAKPVRIGCCTHEKCSLLRSFCLKVSLNFLSHFVRKFEIR